MVAPPWISIPAPTYGGIEKVVRLLCQGLVAHGHQVTLFAAPESESDAHVVAVLDEPQPDQIEHSLIDATHVGSVVDRIDLPGARENHGLLIEPERRRAFIACEGNAKLLVLDLQTKKITASFDVGGQPDVLAYDPGLHRLYVAGEAGIVSMFDVEPGMTSKVGEALLGPHAHVVGVDTSTHYVFFPLEDVGGRTVLRILRPKS